MSIAVAAPYAHPAGRSDVDSWLHAARLAPPGDAPAPREGVVRKPTPDRDPQSPRDAGKTRAELSTYLKAPRSTLHKLALEGNLPAQKVGPHWRFDKEAVEDWLKRHPAAKDEDA